MRKAVLRSIKPYWFYLICEHIKILEIGKTKPDMLKWSGVTYLYCSKDMKSFNRIPKKYQEKYRKYLGMVGARFKSFAVISHCEMANADIAEQYGCISREELLKYSGGKELYGWRISDLVIYDKPKELREFTKAGALSYDDWLYGLYNGTTESTYEKYLMPFKVTRPPQSWYYVEEVG